MPNSKIDKIIQIIRENMVANAPGAQGGFGGKSAAAGPTAGFDAGMKRKKKRYATGGRGSRKNWIDYLRTPINGRSS